MTNDTVKARIDHPLSLLNLNCAAEVRILAHYLSVEQIPRKKYDCKKDRDRPWQNIPAKSNPQAGQDKPANKHDRAKK